MTQNDKFLYVALAFFATGSMLITTLQSAYKKKEWGRDFWIQMLFVLMMIGATIGMYRSM